jgi:hypothetical protein
MVPLLRVLECSPYRRSVFARVCREDAIDVRPREPWSRERDRHLSPPAHRAAASDVHTEAQEVRTVNALRPLSFVFLACAVGASGCYLSHEDAPVVTPVPCASARPPRCVTRTSPCDALSAVAAECVDDLWRCPDDAELYAPPWEDTTCLPLEGELDLFLDGVHEAPLPVPIAGECRWLVPLQSEEGPTHVAALSGRSCGDVRLVSREPALETRGDASYVALQASVVDATGSARALARGWRFDPLAPFGVRDLGVGLARVEGDRVVGPSAWLFDPSVDLGDAALVFEDHLYAFGCPGIPEWIEEDCIVGRAPLGAIDDPSAWRVLGEGGWGEGAPRRVFGSGPHRGPVVRDPRGTGLLHVYAVGFGSSVEITRAPRPEGPWSPAVTLVPCDLPPEDPGAYCAGPVVHLELWDPFEPGTIVIGYSIGTTSDDGDARRRSDPSAYWPRLARVVF